MSTTWDADRPRMNLRLKPREIYLCRTGTIEVGTGDDSYTALEAMDADGRRVFVQITPKQVEGLTKSLTELQCRSWWRLRYLNGAKKTGGQA